MATLTQPGYLLEHDWEQEPYRLGLLEEHADPTTIARLEATGVTRGWRCLEVGAGRGSIASWLSSRVGPSGRVMALDLDTSLLTWLREPNIEVMEGDVLEIEFPPGSFDLIHTRLVLMHIPERRQAIERMVSWLAPGGCLLVEELDWFSLISDPDRRRVALWRGVAKGLPSIDFQCGRSLLDELRDAGLGDTAADVRVDVVDGASRLAQLEALSLLALSDNVLGAGTATTQQIEAHLARLEDRKYRGLGFSWVGVRGRRAAPARTAADN